MIPVFLTLTALSSFFPAVRTETGEMTDGSLGAISFTEQDGMSDITAVPTAPPPDHTPRSRGYRAEQLWVDRAHQNAIANETSISGTGQGIFAGWYLNNKRVSKYNTFGSGTPQWTYPCPEAGAQFDVASTFTGMLSASCSLMQTHVWQSSGSQPSASFETAVAQDMIEVAGSDVLVYVDAGYNLVCLDESSGWSVRWEVPLQTVGNGIYGVDISTSGSRVLVSAYDQTAGAQVYSMADGSLVGSAMGNYGQTKAAISGDGNRVVIGNFNGQIRLYQWSGSAWTAAGTFATGDSWVTSVGISDDGLTAAGGTLGFNPYRGKVVAIDWPSSGSASVMWEYKNYGDYVSSIDICGDGSVIVAGSWGTYNATGGDVFTALDRTGAVIFNLLDDIDEPGSIFSVDISDDGGFATCSGKAVHARQMGNGGEVYGIQIMETQAHDVGVVAVVSPAENQQVGNTVTPQVTVGNFGQSSESFPVSAEIYESEGGTVIWTGTASVNALAPGSSTNVTFPSWTVPEYGSWVFAVATELSGDGYPANDSTAVLVRAYHDAEAVSILCPYAENTYNMQMTPMVKVKNSGTYTDAISVHLVITGAGGTVYDQTTNTSALAPGVLATVSMPPWTPGQVGDYSAELTVSVADDYDPDNNTAGLPFFQIVYEIIYEDGGWESYYWVGSLDDDMFATRFTPTISPPFTATQFRVYVNSTEPFSWGALCPDNGSGMPDIENPLYYVENISASSVPGWLVVPMNVELTTGGDLWFVTHWPDAKALGVGTDTDLPRANRSWWHNKAQGWNNVTYADWSFRLTLMPPTGAPGGQGAPASFALGLPVPNPSDGHFSVSVSVPSADAPFRLAVYDLSGRCLRVLNEGTASPGESVLSWDGAAADGMPAPSGVYFVRLEAPGAVESAKVVLIR